jgi:hypothetical protein
MDGLLGERWGCRLENKGSLPDILGADVVAEVDDPGLRGQAGQDPVDYADVLIL